MLRIVLSRAAFFPWLGILLMAAGAAFPPEGNVGWIVVAVGANVAFYSLHDFSENFEWSQAARPMLTLCGLLFVCGLALVACATLVEPLNRWLALLCTGGYLCLFAVWMTQKLVGWQYGLLTFVGLLLMLGGGIVGAVARDEWRLSAESAETPQDITLADLQRNGFGTNRYLRLKEFRFCDRSAAEKGDGKSKGFELWIPVVPVDGDAVKKDAPAPPVPPRVEVVAAYLSVGNPGAVKPPAGRRDPLDVLRRKREAEGYECTVVTGVKKLKPEVREQLLELAPQTDFAEVIVLHWGKPASADRVRGVLIGSAAALLAGCLFLAVVYVRAWKVMLAEGWQAPGAARDEPIEKEPEQPAG